MLEPLSEHGARQPRRAVQDRAEGLAPEVQVADDQRRPTLGEDLGAASDRTVLAVRSHDCSVASLPPAVKSRLRTSKSGFLTSLRRSPRVAMGAPTRGGTMTAPTDERTRRPSTTASGLEIPGFRGELIAPEHAGYDEARAVWNGTVDRRPRLIARCTGTVDVAAAVRFARDRGLEIAVRGGGHNVAGTAVCDSGIVIDLSALRAVAVNPASRTAHAQGGALWGDVDHETQAYGLATTGGIVSHTGVGGLT